MSIDLDAIRQRADAATPGPWFAAVQRGKVPVVGVPDQALAVCGSPGRQAGRNAEFIAHARQDVTDLLALVDELRAELDYARRSRFEYEERVSEQVENLRAELTQADLVIASMRAALDEADAKETAPEVWSDAVAPGGYVCAAPDPTRPDGICGMPVEDEPCSEHTEAVAR